MIACVSSDKTSLITSFVGSFDAHSDPAVTAQVLEECRHEQVIPISQNLDLLNDFRHLAVDLNVIREWKVNQDVVYEENKDRIIPIMQKDDWKEGQQAVVITESAQDLLVFLGNKQNKSDDKTVYVYAKQLDSTDLLSLARLCADKGFSLILPLERLSFAHDPSGEPLRPGIVDVGDVIVTYLHSDREDGLIPTLVCDESGFSLGLAYSSAQSISEAIRTGTGVYQSRKRGVWYKGATSGATQTLLSIEIDCDNDTLKFTVAQSGPGFCHRNTSSCFGSKRGLSALYDTLQKRRTDAPLKSYTRRLFNDPAMLAAKIVEEAHELVEASDPEHIMQEAADVMYFVLTKCVANDVSLVDVERVLDRRALKITRRPGDTKPKYVDMVQHAIKEASPAVGGLCTVQTPEIALKEFEYKALSPELKQSLLKRPIMKTDDIMSRVIPIMKQVRTGGDEAVIALTHKFDGVLMDSVVVRAPFPPELMAITPRIKEAIDVAFDNIKTFHEAQSQPDMAVETMPGIECSRFARPIQNVGLYVPGGTAVLPSTALMLGIPAVVAGCENIVIATPPRKDGTICPEVVYVAAKVGAKMIVKAGGAQAVAAMAYGTESVLKVDKICGPGNQYVTAAKMVAQNDTSALVSIDMPAGPSELLVIADNTCNPAYVVSDLLSQAEHGPDSQVILVSINLTEAKENAIRQELVTQTNALPRRDIVIQSLAHSHWIKVDNTRDAIDFSNVYAPEHLILHLQDAEAQVKHVMNAGSVFVGSYASESLGDYASGTNHTLPTYGYARMYSGVNTDTFCKYITAQKVTREGLCAVGDHVVKLAQVEGLEAHARAVQIRLDDLMI